MAGGGAIFLGEAMRKRGMHVPMHHEQSCAMAAEAYGRIRGLGVSVVTSGPGGTNAITGVVGAWTDNVPTLTISGQSFSNQLIGDTGVRTLGVQELDILKGVRPWTKYAALVRNPVEIGEHLDHAIQMATTGRPGPVWLDIPADVQNAEVDPEQLSRMKPLPYHYETDFSRVVELLKQAKRPLLHVGHGVRLSGAIRELIKFLSLTRIPTVTARNGNDLIDSDYPSFIGRPGTFGNRGANFAVQTCDLYIAVGTRLCLAQTGYNAKDYARNATIVQVDVDRAELDKGTVRVDHKIHGDARAFLAELCKHKYPNWSEWLQRCKTRYNKYPPIPKQQKLGAYHLSDALSNALTQNDVLVTDMGYSFQCLHQSFRVKWGQRFFTNGGTAAMGWGLPAAFGAHKATGGRVTCVSGDGGLMMNVQELATVAHQNANIKLFILNNDGYLTMRGSQDHAFNARMGSDRESGISFPDFAKLADAFGLPYMRCEVPEAMERTTREALSVSGPVVVELVADPSQALEVRSVNKRVDGKIVPTALEDSWPYLPKEELEENLAA